MPPNPATVGRSGGELKPSLPTGSLLVKDSDYALPIPPAVLAAHPSWLDAEVATSATPVGAPIAPVTGTGTTNPDTTNPAAPSAAPGSPGNPNPAWTAADVTKLAPTKRVTSSGGPASAALPSRDLITEVFGKAWGAKLTASAAEATKAKSEAGVRAHLSVGAHSVAASAGAATQAEPVARHATWRVSGPGTGTNEGGPDDPTATHSTAVDSPATDSPATDNAVTNNSAASSTAPAAAHAPAERAAAPATSPAPATPATAAAHAGEANTPATPPSAPVAPAVAAAPVKLPVAAGTKITAVTAGSITDVAPTPDLSVSSSFVGPVLPTFTVTLTGSDGGVYTYTDVVGAPTVGTATTPGAKIGLSGSTGITFSMAVPDVAGQVCATSALEAWSVGTPVNIRSLPTTCLPGDLSVLTGGTLGGKHQNVLVVTDGSAGNTGADLKNLLGGKQMTTNVLDLDETQSQAAQAAAVAHASVVAPAKAAVPAQAATATTPAKPAVAAMPAVTANLVVIALGGGTTPAEAEALTASLPATQQVLWVVPPAPNGSPDPSAVAKPYTSLIADHPNLRVETLSPALALVTSGTVKAPIPTWSAVGSQVVASAVAGYSATAYRLPTTNSAAATVIAYAEAQLGKPYQWAGDGPSVFDCSGLTMDAFAQVGIQFAHNSNDQYIATKAEAVSEANLTPGDLVFFAGSDGTTAAPGHVGIYVGNGEYIDAPQTGSVVRFDTLSPGDGFVGASDPLATISVGGATTTAGGSPLVVSSGGDQNQDLARTLVDATWNDTQWVYLDALWSRESGWNPFAVNPTSGAYGIPQALPASKMDSVAGDWANDATTQILWGINYIQARYGSPQAAWAHEVVFNWY